MKTLTPLLLLLTPLHAITVLSEADGDLSDSYTAPSEALLVSGLNNVNFTIGVTPENGGGNGAISGPADADFILFRLPVGASVTQMIVSTSEGGRHFFGAREGTSFPAPPGETLAFQNSLDANFIFGEGSDLVLQFLTDPDEDFIALFQETTDLSAFVSIDLFVIPEPSTPFLFTLSVIPALCRRNRLYPEKTILLIKTSKNSATLTLN